MTRLTDEQLDAIERRADAVAPPQSARCLTLDTYGPWTLIVLALLAEVRASRSAEPFLWVSRAESLGGRYSTWAVCDRRFAEAATAGAHEPFEAMPLYAAPPSDCPVEVTEALVKELWQDLIEKTDRTSPAEYPDMALITFDELRAALAVDYTVEVTEADFDAAVAEVRSAIGCAGRSCDVPDLCSCVIGTRAAFRALAARETR